MFALHVTDLSQEYHKGTHRVSANADGIPVWFESSDVELSPAAEAFGCALLLPALSEGSRLTIDAEVDSKWLSNIDQLLDIFDTWWGYPKLTPKVSYSRRNSSQQHARVTGTALCFSGGVDSFYTLLRSEQKIDALVTAQGYDVALQDTTRMSALRSSLQCIAAETKVRPIIIRTNLREHPVVDKTSWDRAHGGALAALGHLLNDSVDRLLISSSYAYVNSKPWGSHWQTDHLWSSERQQIDHVGMEVQRSGKLRAIAREPLVRQHLRVCWENRASQGNCSRCEKCLRTRLVLADCGELIHYPGFEGEESLAQHIDHLSALRGPGKLFSDLLQRGRLTPEVAAAVRRLIKRNNVARSYPRVLAKSTFRKVFAWMSNSKG